MSSQLLSPAIASSSSDPPLPEQRVVLQGVSWQQYDQLLATVGDDFPALRLSYLAGTLEIMTTSPLHEELKTTIAMLMEAYFLETRTRFHAMGSATLRQVAKQRGLEPDECYCLGPKKAFPDLAVEVVLSSGVVDKLEIYEGLGVTEVWVWADGRFAIHHLGPAGYTLVPRSMLLPDCDLELLARYIQPEDQFEAVLEFRDALRARSQT